MNLIALVLSLTPSANAATLDPDVAESLAVRQDIDLRALQAKQAVTEAQLEQTRQDLADAKLAKKTAHKLSVPDPKVAELEAKVVGLEAAIVELRGLIAVISVPSASANDDTVVVLEEEVEPPAPVVEETEASAPVPEPTPVVVLEEEELPEVVVNTINDYRSDFHLIVSAGGGAVVAGQVPGVSGTVSGRVSLAVRPQWDINEEYAFGLVSEGSYELGGWGVRALPTLLTYGKTGEWGVGLGVGYTCNGLTDQGCLAEHVGADLRGSWSKGGMIDGFATVDIEANYLGLSSGESGMELRMILGGGVRFGNPRPNGY